MVDWVALHSFANGWNRFAAGSAMANNSSSDFDALGFGRSPERMGGARYWKHLRSVVCQFLHGDCFWSHWGADCKVVTWTRRSHGRDSNDQKRPACLRMDGDDFVLRD